MNGYELLMLAVGCSTAAIALLPVMAWLRLRAVERGLVSLEAQFSLYAESSMRVAEFVGRPAPTVEVLANESSRRALVHQARQALDTGDSPQACADRLDLRRDERKLMEIARRAMQAA